MLNPAKALNMIATFAQTQVLPAAQRNEFVVKKL